MLSRLNTIGLTGAAMCSLLFCVGCAAGPQTVSSPDGAVTVRFELDGAGRPLYSVLLADRPVIEPSAMGLERSDQSFTEGLTLAGVSTPKRVSDRYTMPHGKRRQCAYDANRRVFTLKNASGGLMQIVFQVSNDGTAFRYAFPDATDKPVSVLSEQTAFAFAPKTTAWLHPMQPGKSGWSKTQPSYEEHYVIDTVGKPSSFGEGWSFPALFKTPADDWALLCDTDVTGDYCAARLAHESTGGVYRLAFPHPQEHRGPVDPVAPQVRPPFQTPWRVVIVGGSLRPLVESTLTNDLASPSRLQNAAFIHPGRAAWHWLRYGDDSSTLDTARKFADFAAAMHWEYVLVDANWDRNIGYEKMAEFVKECRQKGVGVILWYNSNGQWNNAPMTPKDKMTPRQVRRDEFAKLKQMGVKGVKVDFFGGDKQATVQFYTDLFADAADFGIMVNVHGATLPRGWQRTWPNLMTAEAVRGMEYVTFEQRNADRHAQHCTILPFTRNAAASMDFTPVVFDPRIRGVRVPTTPAFELALSVLFESGIQHFGLVPDEQGLMPDYVTAFLQAVPVAWDEIRFVDGFPGRFAILARRHGDTWYVAGINGLDEPLSVTADLSFLGGGRWTGQTISDGPDRTFVKTPVADAARTHTIALPARGGFVMQLKKD